MPDIPRRQCLTEPGQSLILPGDPLVRIANIRRWQEISGLNADQSVSSRVVSVPIPIPEDSWAETGQRRWEDVNPDIMWHPLMWLPERMWPGIIVVDEKTGEESVESVEMWVSRVALEMSISGLYDVDTGTWVDILAINGIDTRNRDDLERVRAWLDGEDDPVLDTIDLSSFLDVPDDPDWAANLIAGIEPALEPAECSLEASLLLGILEDSQREGFKDASLETLAQVAQNVCGSMPTEIMNAAEMNDALSRVISEAADETDPQQINRIADRLHDLLEDMEASYERPRDQVLDLFATFARAAMDQTAVAAQPASDVDPALPGQTVTLVPGSESSASAWEQVLPSTPPAPVPPTSTPDPSDPIAQWSAAASAASATEPDPWSAPAQPPASASTSNPWTDPATATPERGNRWAGPAESHDGDLHDAEQSTPRRAI